MRQALWLGIMFCIGLQAAAANAQLVDREAIFARARAVAAATLDGVNVGDLAPFRIAYSLTLLGTGNPHGGFEVDLLLGSSRSTLPAREVIAAAPDADTQARLEDLLANVELAYYYRSVRVRFAEQDGPPAAAEYSTVLLNGDPEVPGGGLSSETAPMNPGGSNPCPRDYSC